VEEQHRIIKNSETIFINGGDTLAQMSTLNKNSLVDLLHSFDGPIIGISAGAINMAKRSVLPLTKLRTQSYEYKGTGLVNVTVTPHFDMSRRDHIVSEVLPMSYKGVIYGLEENGAVLIKGDVVSLYGGIYKVHNGEIIKIN
jgi:peptidase E